ncbi:MAG TPA: hypothetical protein VGK67_40030 [Myxococcales bacterium]|jgi:hypothetical protein
MARALRRALPLLAVLVLAGCPTTAGNTPCEKACHKSLDIYCSSEPVATCAKSCEDTRTALEGKPQYCQDAYAHYIDCLAAMTNPQCGFKSLDPGECRPAMDHYKNYCILSFTPEEPCVDSPPILNALCADKPQQRPRSCMGEVESGCVMGGDSDFANVYCCPGDPVAGDDAGTPKPDGGGPAFDAGPSVTGDAGAPRTDAGAPSADAGTPAGPDFGDVLDACSNIIACDYYGVPDRIREGLYLCANWLINTKKPSTEVAPDVDIGLSVACGRTATTCNEFVLCMNGGAYDKAYCSAHPEPACDGTKSVLCGSSMAPVSVVTDCAPSGNTCELVDGSARCVTSQACPQTAGACTGTTGYWRCESGMTRATHVQCLAGSSCQLSTTLGSPVCVGDTACSGASRCEGNMAVECATAGEFQFERRSDCSLLEGYACISGGCSPSETQCLWTVNADRCTGDVFQGCVAGRTVSFDCKAHGFARCGDYNGVKSCLY